MRHRLAGYAPACVGLHLTTRSPPRFLTAQCPLIPLHRCLPLGPPLLLLLPPTTAASERSYSASLSLNLRQSGWLTGRLAGVCPPLLHPC